MKRRFRARDYWPDPKRDVAEEFRSHLELKVEDLTAQGFSEEEAWDEARRAFGDSMGNGARAEAHSRTRLRRAGLKDRFDTLSQDVSFAIRRMARAPGFTAAAVLSLAIGIGANTGVFSIVNALLLRPPPYDNPSELVRIYTAYPGLSPWGSSSYLDYRDLRELDEVFADVAVFYNILAPVTIGEELRMSMVEAVSANFLSMLGVEPALGRGFLPEDDQEPGANRVVIVGHGFWNRALGADPEVLGSTLRIGGSAYTVVGVAPESYGSGVLPSLKSDLLVPVTQGAEIEGHEDESVYSNRQYRTYDVEARLRPGVSIEEARVRLELFSANLKEAYPDLDQDRTFKVVPATDVTVSPEIDQGLPFIAGFLLAVVGLVLLLACANLASFLLAQGVNRRPEIAVRLAMGAPRRRLVRQLLSETVLLGLLGGAAGVVLASWTLGLLVGILPQLPAPVDLELGLDGRVLLFSLTLSLFAGVLFGLVPALQSTSPDINATLKDAGLAQGKRRHRLRSGLVAFQMAISVVLLVGGGLFVRSLVVAESIDPGFSVRGIGTAWIDLAMSGVPRDEWVLTEASIRDRLRAEPGVRAVATASHLPLAMGSSFQLFNIPGAEPPPGQDHHRIHFAQVSPDFFQALGVPILAGRGFTAQDQRGTPDVAVVSEAMANRFWPGQDPIGKEIQRGEARRSATVVGLARDTKVERLGEAPLPFIYFSSSQYPTSFVRLVVRAEGDASGSLATLRRVLHEMKPDFAIMDVRSMEDHLALLLFPSRVAALLLGLFGGLALLLCAIGLYGVVDFSVSSRTREIGIRMSLGAKGGSVVGSMMKGALRWVAVGGLAGLLVAVVLARLIQGFLFGVGAGDPFTLILVPLLLGGVATVAAFVPARRAARIDPVDALRKE